MHARLPALRTVPVAATALLLLAGAGHPATYTIEPDGTGDFATIEFAINVAVAGDLILLADGVFTGSQNRNLSFKARAITIRSASGDPDACIIDCEGLEPAFLFQSGETSTSVLEGVTIVNARSPAVQSGKRSR